LDNAIGQIGGAIAQLAAPDLPIQTFRIALHASGKRRIDKYFDEFPRRKSGGNDPGGNVFSVKSLIQA
jgi:hypothetical protein